MQINRLFEMVYILLNKKSITAKELAIRFEVSQRTIYRDIETLSQAGIPIYTNKGKGGGIGLLEGFILDKSVLSEREQGEILSSLQGIQAMRGAQMAGVLSKLSSLFGTSQASWIEVDLSDWGFSNQEKFSELKRGILEKKVVNFDYFGTYGEKSSRQVEPMQLWFKDKTWYLKAFCKTKEEMRIFKLSRLKSLKVTEETFVRECSEQMLVDFEGFNKQVKIELTLEIAFSQAFRVYDEFDENNIFINSEGNFIVTIQEPEEEWLFSWIISYGTYAKVISPLSVQRFIKKRLLDMALMYP